MYYYDSSGVLRGEISCVLDLADLFSDYKETCTVNEEGEYYLYLFNNNFGASSSNPSYDWKQIAGIETSMNKGKNSYYYKYKVDETKGIYSLVQVFAVPYSAYVSSAQEYDGNII